MNQIFPGKSNPNSPSYIKKDIKALYRQHEKEKKRSYVERVTQVEKGSFTPFVMSTSGGMGTEAELFVKRIAILIATKRNEEYSFVVNYIRTRLSFCMLKSVLLSLRGERGKKVTTRHTPLSNLLFNLIQFDDSWVKMNTFSVYTDIHLLPFQWWHWQINCDYE